MQSEGYISRVISLIALQLIVREITEAKELIKERVESFTKGINDETRFAELLRYKKEKFLGKKRTTQFLNSFIEEQNERINFRQQSPFSIQKNYMLLNKENSPSPLKNQNGFNSPNNPLETSQSLNLLTSFKTDFLMSPSQKDSTDLVIKDTRASTFKNNFRRDSNKHKTSPVSKRKNKFEEIKTMEELNKQKVQYSKTTPLAIISRLYNFKMISSNQRGYLKELIFENNQVITEYIESYENDGNIESLYRKLSELLQEQVV